MVCQALQFHFNFYLKYSNHLCSWSSWPTHLSKLTSPAERSLVPQTFHFQIQLTPTLSLSLDSTESASSFLLSHPLVQVDQRSRAVPQARGQFCVSVFPAKPSHINLYPFFLFVQCVREKDWLRVKLVLPVCTVAKIAARLLLKATLQSQVHWGLGSLPTYTNITLDPGPKNFIRS